MKFDVLHFIRFNWNEEKSSDNDVYDYFVMYSVYTMLPQRGEMRWQHLNKPKKKRFFLCFVFGLH